MIFYWHILKNVLILHLAGVFRSDVKLISMMFSRNKSILHKR